MKPTSTDLHIKSRDQTMRVSALRYSSHQSVRQSDSGPQTVGEDLENTLANISSSDFFDFTSCRCRGENIMTRGVKCHSCSRKNDTFLLYIFVRTF